MPIAHINGTEIFFEDLGQGEPVALLNGIMMTTQSWVLQTSVLRKRYRCVLHDMRGQLMSGKPEEDYTLAQHADDFRRLLDYLRLDRVHVVGTSYGGEVGMIFAISHPERVQSLCVISCVSYVEADLRRQVQLWAEAAARSGADLYRVATPVNFSSRFRERHREIIEQGEARVRSYPKDYFRAFIGLVDAFKQIDITQELEKIRSPTLVICGEQDELKPVSYSRKIANSIPGAELVVVPDAGHAVVIEQAETINTLICRFIEQNPSAGVGSRPERA